MSGVLCIEMDPTEESVAEAIAGAARFVPFLVIGGRMFADLAAKLGSDDAAARHLLVVAEAVDRPLGVHVERGDGAGTTMVIAPRSWTQERLRGWVGGKHAELTEMFGPATVREASA